LKALLLQAFFSPCSERQLVEQLDHDLLFRWFVGLPMDAAIWDATMFCKNGDRLLEGVAREFPNVLAAARACREPQTVADWAWTGGHPENGGLRSARMCPSNAAPRGDALER
jgi:Transposase domain (DUF772)